MENQLVPFERFSQKISSGKLTPANIATFRRLVYKFYTHNRRDFPWRNTIDPYRILISELMLQQTQTHRVVPKYQAFIKHFPTISSLAHAPFRDVMQLWQGLGYNRRALYLHKAAQEVVKKYDGVLPRSQSELVKLPGIGPYTAAAVGAFAFNQSTIMLETNIRSVILYIFFRTHRGTVDDKKVMRYVEQTRDTKNPHKWYSALMDLGAYIKTHEPNPSRKSTQYQMQTVFAGSDRLVRGAIMKVLVNHQSVTLAQLQKLLTFKPIAIDRNLHTLVREGLILKRKARYSLAN